MTTFYSVIDIPRAILIFGYSGSTKWKSFFFNTPSMKCLYFSPTIHSISIPIDHFHLPFISTLVPNQRVLIVPFLCLDEWLGDPRRWPELRWGAGGSTQVDSGPYRVQNVDVLDCRTHSSVLRVTIRLDLVKKFEFIVLSAGVERKQVQVFPFQNL